MSNENQTVAAMGSQLLLRPDSPRSSRLPFSFGRHEKVAVGVSEVSVGVNANVSTACGVLPYLLDAALCVGSGRGADLAAGTRWLVDKSA